MSHFRPALFCLTLAACATTETYGPACACVIIPVSNGTLAFSVDGENYRQGTGRTEGLYRADAGLQARIGSGDYSRFELVVYATDDPFNFTAYWPRTDPVRDVFDATATAVVEAAAFRRTEEFTTIGRYELGPRGGTARITEIVPGTEDAALRVRGEMRAQMCNVADPGDCISVVSRFAFDEEAVPDPLVLIEPVPIIDPA